MQRRDFLRNTMFTGTALMVAPNLLKASKYEVSALSATVDANMKGEKLVHFWSKCVGAGRANEGLRASWQEQLKLVKDQCGFQYCRFHGLFHDDMFVYKEVDGNPKYNWQYVDDLFDRMLAVGVKPFVELGFVPKAMASTPTTVFWWKGNIAPPIDYNKWGALVAALAKHCVDRYGLEEVKSWYFEVWNEPDLHVFWDGTKSQYFELYKTSVNAIKGVDKNLRVGGPATSNFVPDSRFDGEVEDKTQQKTLVVPDINALEWQGVWIKDFLAYCTKENLPIDFISSHPYPTDWAIDPGTKKGAGRVRKVNATKEDLQWLRKTVAESAYPNAQIHCTEWSSSPSPRDATHDSLQAATYIIKANVDSIGLVDSLSYWTFTDVFEEGGAGDSIFHGGFGLINYQGIPKPSFHAYRMLNALGNEVLHKEEGLIVTRNSTTKEITALMFHYPVEMKDTVGASIKTETVLGSPKKFSFQLNGLRPSANIIIETLDKNNGFAYQKWKAIGSPEPPSISQTAEIKTAAFATKKEKFNAKASGSYLFERILQPWDCVLLKYK